MHLYSKSGCLGSYIKDHSEIVRTVSRFHRIVLESHDFS